MIPLPSPLTRKEHTSFGTQGRPPQITVDIQGFAPQAVKVSIREYGNTAWIFLTADHARDVASALAQRADLLDPTPPPPEED